MTSAQSKIERNISLIYLFSGLHMMLVLIPVIIPFFNSRGLDMQQVFMLQGIFSIGVLLFELPSGYFSDLIGRKKTLVASSVFWALGFACFPLSTGFWELVVGEIFMAIAISLSSGTDISLLYDSLEVLEKKKAPVKVVGKKLFYGQIGETIGGLIGGWLVMISIEFVAWTQVLVSCLPIAVVFFIHEPERKKMDKKKHRENAIYIFKAVFGHSRLLTLIVLNSMFYSLSTLIAVWTYQKYWQELGIELKYFGYLWALTNLSVALMARYVHKIEKRMGSLFVVLLMSTLPIIGYFGMSWVGSVFGVLFCIFFQISRAINQVIFGDALNRRVTGDLRATANSVTSLGMRLLFVVGGPLVGYMIDQKGLSYTFQALGIFYLIVFIALAIPLVRQKENFAKIP